MKAGIWLRNDKIAAGLARWAPGRAPIAFARTFLLYCFFCMLNLAALHAQVPSRYDIVIDELLPDPSPVVALPNSEFIELKNVSATVFNLRGWKISDGASTATINSNYILKPDSFVIICPASSASAYAVFGPAIGVSSFPSLNNDGDIVSLISPQGHIIHSVAYSLDWYHNDAKSGGGWTLEMIDPKNPCGGAGNWAASTHPSGGTPGKKNAVHNPNPDRVPPRLLRTYTVDSVTVMAVFDEPVDSASGSQAASFQFGQDMGPPLRAAVQAPLFTEVMLTLKRPLAADSVYNLTVRGVADCAGNPVGGINMAKAGLPAKPVPGEIIINELLFDPLPGGYDYIELYNGGRRTVDLKQLFIANRKDNGALDNIVSLSGSPRLFFPGDYLVITANSSWLQQQYLVKDPLCIIIPAAMPSLPDDKGKLVLGTAQAPVIDELHYDEKWHFSLIANREGVALERIDPKQPAQDRNNWTSAASVAGFGTPGQQNSQFKRSISLQGEVVVDPPVFSPDNDGADDLLFIRYQFPAAGQVANISIFNANGQLVRSLARNATLMATGYFRWDGLDHSGHKLPIGIYVILTETFAVNGDTRKFKSAVSLTRRL